MDPVVKVLRGYQVLVKLNCVKFDAEDFSTVQLIIENSIFIHPLQLVFRRVIYVVGRTHKGPSHPHQPPFIQTPPNTLPSLLLLKILLTTLFFRTTVSHLLK